MKTSIVIAALVLFSSYVSAQTPESVQRQINFLEEEKKNLQLNIEEIDNQLDSLHKKKHELTLAQYYRGFPARTIKDVDLYDTFTPDRNTLIAIPEETLLLIEEYVGGALKTSYSNITGYIPASFVRFENDNHYEILKEQWSEQKEEMAKQREIAVKQRIEQLNRKKELREREKEVQAEKRRQQAQKEAEAAIRARENKIRSKYSASIAEKILKRQIWLGMTKDMLIDSWGYPGYDDINRTVGSWGVHEQWIYNDTYVYLENGIVTSWQD